MQQSFSFPFAASTRFLKPTSLPRTVEEQYWTLPKLSRIFFLPRVLRDRIQLFADFLDLVLGDDLGIGEADDEHTVDIFDEDARWADPAT